MQVIRLVEESPVGVKQTLAELNINRSTFYEWYRRYQQGGFEALANRYRPPKQFWNQIPPWERQRVVEIALEHPEKSPRELAWYMTDKRGYYISESSVYRILKAHDLVTSPVYTVISARDKFPHPTKAPNELWQTDFTWFKVVHWGWYYLCSVLDDYSRYILAWQLCTGMSTEDVKATIEAAIRFSGVRDPRVLHRPRILSDNGPCYISAALKEYLEQEGMAHTRGRPYHPMTQGKIERYHRSMKNILLLENYYSPDELVDQIDLFIEYYNNQRYHEELNNLIPVDVYCGKAREIMARREKTRKNTMLQRRRYNCSLMVA
jgi:transposase InsO family protein